MPSNAHKTILSLCDSSGNWSNPYREAGYNVIQVDLDHGQDVRLLKFPGRVHGIIAQPPCTHLSSAGAASWAAKGEGALLEALQVVDACLRFVAVCKPIWWVLENPKGRISQYLGKPQFTFNPCDYGDAYKKRTCLWGSFVPPLPLIIGEDMSVEPIKNPNSGDHSIDNWLKSQGYKIGKHRAKWRSLTPPGFAQAFFLANP